MTLSRTIILYSDAQAQYLADYLKQYRRPMADAGTPLRVRVDLYDKHSDAQRNLFHGLCGDVSKQRQWLGGLIHLTDWKRLFVDSWERIILGRPARVSPSLDGTGIVTLGTQTRNLGKKAYGELITTVYQWGDEQGVIFKYDHMRQLEELMPKYYESISKKAA